MADKPSFELVVAADRVANGDTAALKDLWLILFEGQEFDPKRPAEDIANDCAKRITELYPPAEPEPNPAEKWVEEAVRFVEEIGEIFFSKPLTKK